MHSSDIKDLVIALSKAQGEFQPAIKDSTNPHFRSKFADLASIWAVCRPVLSKHGLAVMQTYERDGDKMNLITTLAHSSGQWIKSCAPILLGKMDSQALGSASTYMKRYSLSAILGIVADDDDDGEKSMPKISKSADSSPELQIPPSPGIGKELADALELQLKQTPEEYRNKVFARFKKLGFHNLSDIPMDIFNVAMPEAIKNIGSSHASK